MPNEIVRQAHYHCGEYAVLSRKICGDDVRNEERAYYRAENNIERTDRCRAREVLHHVGHRLIERYHNCGQPKYRRLPLSSKDHIGDKPDQDGNTKQPQEDFQKHRSVYVVRNGKRELYVNVGAGGERMQAV